MYKIYKFIVIVLIFSSLTSCVEDFQRHIVGNGKIVSVTRNLSNFDIVSSSGSFNIEIIKDSISPRVEIEAEGNLIDFIETNVNGNELEIHNERRTNISHTKPINIKVFTNNLSGINLSGSGIINSNTFTGNNFEVGLSGSGNINFGFSGNSLTCSISGSGRISMIGKVIRQDIKVSGSGAIDALDMESENTIVDISGSGNAKIFATHSLDATISGSGDVTYKGNPLITTSISGSGKLIHW